MTPDARAPWLSYRFFDRRSFKPSFLFNTLLALFILQEPYSRGLCLALLYIPRSVVIYFLFLIHYLCTTISAILRLLRFGPSHIVFLVVKPCPIRSCLICLYLQSDKSSLRPVSNCSIPNHLLWALFSLCLKSFVNNMAPAAPPLPTRFPCWCRAVYSWGGEVCYQTS